MSKIKDGGPAFPIPNDDRPGAYEAHPGMDLRDWFAGQIANGMAAYSGTSGVSYGPGEIAGRSYEIADAMLRARSESGQ
jgi:hypothetical protein